MWHAGNTTGHKQYMSSIIKAIHHSHDVRSIADLFLFSQVRVSQLNTVCMRTFLCTQSNLSYIQGVPKKCSMYIILCFVLHLVPFKSDNKHCSIKITGHEHRIISSKKTDVTLSWYQLRKVTLCRIE